MPTGRRTSLLSAVVVLSGFLLVVVVNASPLAARARFGTNWILDPFDDTKFTAEENKVFEPILTNTGLKLDKKITEDGSNNDGIFSLSAPYKGHPADSLLVKVLHMVYEGALGEVKALNMKHQVIASGMLADPKIGPKEKPVIVMMKQPGKKLLDDEEFQKASNEEKLAMRKEALELMCEELAQEAVEKLMYHADNNIANLMVVVKNKKIVSARVVDYGGDAVYHVKQGVKKEDVKAFCLKINPATWA